MSDFFIPPPGLAFRLIGRRSNRVLVANPNDTLTDYELGKIYPDQWFTLEHAPPSGQFYIKSTYKANDGKVIFCRAAEGEVGIFRKDHHDQHFVLEPGDGDFLGSFRLYAPSAGMVITAQPKPNTYHVADSRPIGTITTFFHVELTNKSDDPAKLVADMSQAVSETASFDFRAGFTISVAASFRAGIPFIAKGEIKTEVSASTDFTWGKTTTIETKVGSSVEILVPPRSSQEVVASFKQSTVNLTATIYSKSKSTGVEVITKAEYKGTPAWGHNYTVQEAKPLSG
ncbi:hypothetical protein PITC_033640 [Penicillium italicum]|uniref:Uncharacterized protein n=1 Tax=Penicillium italicum TaxID=40296 RepID=A0A0A2LGS9_PENIT|nr:hypothetical protein PITC_033640 [Penicillium italicum]